VDPGARRGVPAPGRRVHVRRERELRHPPRVPRAVQEPRGPRHSRRVQGHQGGSGTAA
jgi:hypothetical protein